MNDFILIDYLKLNSERLIDFANNINPELIMRDGDVNEISLKDLYPYMDEDNVLDQVPLLIEKYLKSYNIKYFFSHANILKIKNGSMNVHFDEEIDAGKLRIFTTIIYLNDVKEGGELVFPIQNIRIKPERNKIVIIPASFMYPHYVDHCNEDRYVLKLQYYIETENYNGEYNYIK